MLVRLLTALASGVAGYAREMDRGSSILHDQEVLLGRPHRERGANGLQQQCREAPRGLLTAREVGDSGSECRTAAVSAVRDGSCSASRAHRHGAS